MLNAIRTASSKWLGRVVLTIIMGVLIVSFAIWGIGDIFRGGVNRMVASVGETKIGAEDFRQAFNLEIQRIQRQARRVVTTDEARAFGLDRQVLNRLIDEAALSQRARALGLAVDQALVTRSIVEAPDFKVGGVFDRERLADALRQAGISEQTFLQRQAELVLRRQLYNGLVGALPGAEALGRAVHQFRVEERNLDVVTVPADKVPEPAPPEEAALRGFFEERKAEFRTTETRRVTLLQIGPADFAAEAGLTEAELRAFYARQVPGGRFGPPERRQIDRVLFDTEAEARDAAARLAAGTGFEALLAERKLAAKDVDFGRKSAGEIADPAIRDAVFALPEGGVSAPLKDAFGFVLFRVRVIEPGQVAPFETVRAQIEAEARLDKVRRDPAIRTRLDQLVRRIEDQRLAGKSLAEAAEAAGLKPVTILALDRSGRDGQGNAVAVPGGADAVNAIFASDIGLDNEPLQTREGGHVWYEVNGVEPARDKTFEEVAAEVRARYLADQRGKALARFTDDLVKRIENGEALAAIAAELGRPVEPYAGIRRASREPGLGVAGVERAFSAPVGKPVSTTAPDGTGRLILIARTTSLLPYDPAADERSGFVRELGQGIAEDMMAQYIAAIRQELGVSINQAVLNQALGQAN
ncbi:MAG: SurA N-terminal domain-containing protein [Hyphomicrobiales bacterium]|nr:SurA N-terminal domain-containing protein [Hyphomicrobiales bacterium]MCA1999766.1 SurA N-terminal domain-containing protein [Hyphomicrobiales bacterium]